MKRARGVLLASGGIDSTVLAYWLKKQRLLTSLVFVDYGQAGAHETMNLVFMLGEALRVKAHREYVSLPEHMTGTGPTTGRSKPKAQKDPYAPLKMKDEKAFKRWQKHTWDINTGRNTMLLLVAASRAIQEKVPCVYAGFQFDEPEWEAMYEKGYQGFVGVDTSPAYVDAFNHMTLAGGLHEDITVMAPFLDRRMTKTDIVAMAKELSIDLDKTYSCKFWPRCGKCRQCVVRDKVLSTT